MSDKPIHVQVAEALGWTEIQLARELRQVRFVGGLESRGVYVGRPPGPLILGYESPPIPDYDTDWAATGPLIERYRIKIQSDWDSGWVDGDFHACISDKDCVEFATHDNGEVEGNAPTPLLAVCNLILALHKAGKLNPTSQTSSAA